MQFGSEVALAFLCLCITSIESRAFRETSEVKTTAQNSDLLRDIAKELKNQRLRVTEIDGKDGKTGEVEVVLERILREFTQFQKDLHYLEMIVNEGNTMPYKATKGAFLKGDPMRKYPQPDASVNDVVSEGDDAEEIKRQERNYYGWMDFGK